MARIKHDDSEFEESFISQKVKDSPKMRKAPAGFIDKLKKTLKV